MEKSLQNIPASAFAKIIPLNKNLNELRKCLYNSNINEQVLKILEIKYFPERFFEKHKINASTYLSSLDVPGELAAVIRKSLAAAGCELESERVTVLTRAGAQSQSTRQQPSGDAERKCQHQRSD